MERDAAETDRVLGLPSGSKDEFFKEWMRRISNPGLRHNVFWIAQNALVKVLSFERTLKSQLGERILPSLIDTAAAGKGVSDIAVWVVAAALRYLCPVEEVGEGLFRGVIDNPLALQRYEVTMSVVVF